jgi:Uncharacterised protein family (UPF0240).
MGARIAKAKSVGRNPSSLIKNVEKVLNEKRASPRHPSTVKSFDELVKAHPEFEESAKQKNENLHTMLDSIRVDSTGAAPTDVLKTGKKTRKLKVIPEGKLSDKQLQELFLNRKLAPEAYTVEKTANEYKLDIDVAKNLLQYYGSFYIYKEKNNANAMEIGSGKSFLQPDEEPKHL